MTDDDDVPPPDLEATPAERARAQAFGALIDRALAGRAAPPALSADDRALLEVATVIRAAHGGVELAPARRTALVEDALRQAVGGGQPSGLLPKLTVDIARARSARTWVPWAISAASSAVAIAAITLLWLRGPGDAVAPTPSATATIPDSWRSRPADPLIGEIARAQSGDASARLDVIFADRLAGYRERRLSRRGVR